MKEAKERVVEIKDTESNIVEEFLRFLYTGEVENLDKIYMPLFQLAHTYLVEDLKTKCEHFIVRHLDVNNVLEMYVFAKTYELRLVSKRARQIIFL